MGIKGFSKTFTNYVVVDNSIMFNKRIAIDASNELYRHTQLIYNSNNDKEYEEELIKRVLTSIYLRKQVGINEIWVFDYYQKGYINPHKIQEQQERTNKKQKILNKVEKTEVPDKNDKPEEFVKYMKLCNSTKTLTCNDVGVVKNLLKCLYIPFINTPQGLEGEQICALLNMYGIVDYVYSDDADCLVFGCKQLIRRYSSKDVKELRLFKLENILTEYKITMNEFIMINIMLGCDFYKNSTTFRGIGPKTAFKKIKDQSIINIFNNDADVKKVFEYFRFYYNCFNKQSIERLRIKINFIFSNKISYENKNNEKQKLDEKYSNNQSLLSLLSNYYRLLK